MDIMPIVRLDVEHAWVDSGTREHNEKISKFIKKYCYRARIPQHMVQLEMSASQGNRVRGLPFGLKNHVIKRAGSD